MLLTQPNFINYETKIYEREKVKRKHRMNRRIQGPFKATELNLKWEE